MSLDLHLVEIRLPQIKILFLVFLLVSSPHPSLFNTPFTFSLILCTGLRMTAGDPTRRSYDPTKPGNQAVSYVW